MLVGYQTKDAILRSESRWYNEGEKNTKYFLNLEIRHCIQGTITWLKINDNEPVQSDREILHERETFTKICIVQKRKWIISRKTFFLRYDKH